MQPNPNPRSTLAVAILFGTLLVVAAGLVAVNGSDRTDFDAPHVVRDGSDTTVVAPGTRVESEGDRTRIKAPFVDITVPRDND